MKKILFYLSVCLVMGLASCSSDSGDESAIVGTWRTVSKEAYDAEGNASEYYQEYFVLYNAKFNSDGTCTASWGIDAARSLDDGTYRLSGKRLDMVIGSIWNLNFAVEEQTSTTMKLRLASPDQTLIFTMRKE